MSAAGGFALSAHTRRRSAVKVPDVERVREVRAALLSKYELNEYTRSEFGKRGEAVRFPDRKDIKRIARRARALDTLVNDLSDRLLVLLDDLDYLGTIDEDVDP